MAGTAEGARRRGATAASGGSAEGEEAVTAHRLERFLVEVGDGGEAAPASIEDRELAAGGAAIDDDPSPEAGIR